jgi:AcrR family transcriptional regulator
MTAYPSAKMEEVAEEAGVNKQTVYLWLRDPEFVEVFYQKYMVSFGSKLPSILNAMIREAEAGNVQAGRLILEHSGKLIKRVEVNNHISPFEKFLDKEVPSDFKEEVEEAEFTVLPQRPTIPEKKEKSKTKSQELKELYDKKRYLKKRREAQQWRKRATKSGIDLLQRGRKTESQMRNWHDKIIQKEAENKAIARNR